MPSRKWLKPVDLKVADARAIINTVASNLKLRDFQREVGIQVTEVFVGGSIGQGTTVPGHYDADLVLYSRDLHHGVAAADGYKHIQEKMKRYLKAHLGAAYRYEEETEVAITFTYQSHYGIHLKVDLLLSPYWGSQEEFFMALGEVKPPLKRLMFSVGASKYQTQLIKCLKATIHMNQRQCSKVKELIRRAKSWRNRSWEADKRGRPKSYLISLLVITAHRRVHHLGMPFNDLAKRVGEEMKALLHVITTDDKLDLIIPGPDPAIRERYTHLLPPCPRIVDPVNPSNNLYLSGVGPDPYGEGDGKWTQFKKKVASINLNIK